MKVAQCSPDSRLGAERALSGLDVRGLMFSFVVADCSFAAFDLSGVGHFGLVTGLTFDRRRTSCMNIPCWKEKEMKML